MAIEVLSRETFMASPAEGTAVHASTYYTTKDTPGLMSIHGYETRSDTCDASFVRFSGVTTAARGVRPRRFRRRSRTRAAQAGATSAAVTWTR